MEFDTIVDDDGKKKAIRVTGIGGGPCTGPRIRRKREHSERSPTWHSTLNQEVKSSLRGKSVRTKTGTVDVALDEYRIKLGTVGYASMVHADGIVAEGSFTAEEDGSVTLTWDRAISYDGDEWTSRDTVGLLTSLSLMDGKRKWRL